MAILSCKDLNVQYDNQVALKDVNFELEDGDYLCIIGDKFWEKYINEVNSWISNAKVR